MHGAKVSSRAIPGGYEVAFTSPFHPPCVVEVLTDDDWNYELKGPGWAVSRTVEILRAQDMEVL